VVSGNEETDERKMIDQTMTALKTLGTIQEIGARRASRVGTAVRVQLPVHAAPWPCRMLDLFAGFRRPH